MVAESKAVISSGKFSCLLSRVDIVDNTVSVCLVYHNAHACM